MIHKRASRLDVAKAAKVSLLTVTYSLNPSAKIRIGAKTRERVRRIAEQLGYRPNYVRRAISAGRTFAIGLIIPDQRSLLFPFYEMIIDGCVARMNADDFDPLLLSRARPDRIAKVIRDGRVDGIVIIQSDLDDRPIRQIITSGLPYVVLNRDLPRGLESDRVGCVYSDHRRMLDEVVNEFVSLGCRRILNFSDVGGIFASRECFEGFNSAIARHAQSGVIGSTVPPVWDHFAPQAKGLFEQGNQWDGIFVNGSPAAGALLNAAENKGVKVGRDFQLITTDAYPETEAYGGVVPHRRRERTVYWQQPRKVGEEGWRLMATLLEGTSGRPHMAKVPYLREANSAPGNVS